MKILRLDLLRFGHFTDRTLDLSGGTEGLHVIVGPNEAGKSTLLRGLTDWLFGFEQSSRKSDNRDTQRWTVADLQVGGLLRATDGSTLECIRRVNKPTLVNASRLEEVDPKRLEQMLSGIDRRSFSMRWGINYQALHEGGQAIVSGEGEIAQTLFVAGSGLLRLDRILRDLQSKQQDLYRSRGKNQELNLLTSAHKQLTKELQQTLLQPDSYQKLEHELQQLTSSCQQLTQRTTEIQRQIDYLARLQQAQIPFRRWREADQKLDALPESCSLADDFATRYRELNRLKIEQTARQNLETTRVAQIEQALQQLQRMPHVLDAASQISDLVEKSGADKKALQDVVGLCDERDQLREALLQQQASLAIENLQLEDALERLSESKHVQLLELADQLKALDDDRSRAAQELENLKRDVSELDEQLPDQTDYPDPTLVDSWCNTLQSATEDVRRCEHEWSACVSRFERAVGSLGMPVINPYSFVQQILPTDEWIQQQIQQANQLRLLRTGFSQRKEVAEQSLEEQQRKLAELHSNRVVPTREDLTQSRSRRDQTLQSLRQSLSQFGPQSSPELRNLAISQSDLLEEQVRIVDQLQDALFHGHELAARQHELVRSVQQLTASLAALAAEELRLVAAEEEFQTEWKTAWADLPPKAWEPALASSWLERYRTAWQAAQATLSAERACLLPREQVQQHMAEIKAHAGSRLGQPSTQPETLLKQLQSLSAQIRESQATRKAQAASRRRLTKRLEQSQQEDADRAKREAPLRSAWQQLLKELHWENDLSPSQAQTLLRAIDRLRETRREVENREHRISRIQSDHADFERAVDALAGPLLPDNHGQSAQQTVSALQRLQREAETTALEDQRLTRDRDQLLVSLGKLQQEQIRLDAGLQALCQEAGCAGPEELPEAIERSQRRTNLQMESAQARAEVEQLAVSTDWDEFLHDLQQHSAEYLRDTLERLIAERDAVSAERSPAEQELGALRSKIDALTNQQKAAELNQQLEENEALQAAVIKRYVRLRISDSILRLAMERYRSQHESSVLHRASEIFRQLTGGAFVEIRPELIDKDRIALHGIRSEHSAPVRVQQMSSGTADQLYLALRLASLQEHLDQHPPLPLIIDDLLVMFDDTRAIAALHVLSQIAKRTQVIYLTHHPHLVDLARAQLDPSELFVHPL
jgi:uncharacterized protein YhaN